MVKSEVVQKDNIHPCLTPSVYLSPPVYLPLAGLSFAALTRPRKEFPGQERPGTVEAGSRQQEPMGAANSQHKGNCII